jgi:hypothetical protein
MDGTLQKWNNSSLGFPDLGAPWPTDEQQRRESIIDRDLAHIDHELAAFETNAHSSKREDAERTVQSIVPLMSHITETALDLEDSYVRSLLNEGLAGISLDLVCRAREIDPMIGLVDVLQAARNAWTACALQVLFGAPLRLTPSIFAYSLLYPYSDNYLDDPAISPHAKASFNGRFGQRLAGDELTPHDDREAIIWHLVGLIESEYPREAFPLVYEALLAIHAAQQHSVRQLHDPARFGDDVAVLTITKGGTSVLADACLAAGEMSEDQARIAFEWGVVLQLGDDLQDFRTDRSRSSCTLFTQAARHQALDAITNQTFHFAQNVMKGVQQLQGCRDSFKHLLSRSSRLLLIRSAAGIPESYTQEYMDSLQRHSPLRFESFRTRERSLARHSRASVRLFEGLSAF